MRKLLKWILLLIMLLGIPTASAEDDPFFEAYDITNTSAVWARLMEDIVVLDAGEKGKIFPPDAPNGNRLYDDKLGGYIYGKQQQLKYCQRILGAGR